MAKPVAAGSRERMIDSTIDLMRGYGLSGAGINDIVRDSGAPKGSVYHYFPDGKLQIATEALAVYSVRVRAFIDQAVSGKARPEDQVKALFAAFARRVEAGDYLRSCAVGAVSLDLGDELEALRLVLATAFDDWRALIASRLQLADTRRSRSFAGLVLTAIEGAYIRSRVERSSRPFQEAGAWLAELAAAHRAA
jgi:AcrR family transcriptional regulator